MHSDSSSGIMSQHLIAESNFHVYSYSTHFVDQAILSIFADITLRLANVVIAHITYTSTLRAFKLGCTAAHINGYLNHHIRITRATPATSSALSVQAPSEDQTKAVLLTITSQISLWEEERARVKFQAGVLYDDFDDDLFAVVLAYVERRGLILWKNAEKKLLFVRDDAHDQVKEFIRLHRAT